MAACTASPAPDAIASNNSPGIFLSFLMVMGLPFTVAGVHPSFAEDRVHGDGIPVLDHKTRLRGFAMCDNEVSGTRAGGFRSPERHFNALEQVALSVNEELSTRVQERLFKR
jgi:hypothetical protein